MNVRTELWLRIVAWGGLAVGLAPGDWVCQAFIGYRPVKEQSRRIRLDHKRQDM